MLAMETSSSDASREKRTRGSTIRIVKSMTATDLEYTMVVVDGTETGNVIVALPPVVGMIAIATGIETDHHAFATTAETGIAATTIGAILTADVATSTVVPDSIVEVTVVHGFNQMIGIEVVIVTDELDTYQVNQFLK